MLQSSAATQSHSAGKLPLARRTSEESNDTGESHNVPPEIWFDRSNKNIGGRLGPQLLDDDPPFFLQNHIVQYPNLSSNSEELGNPPTSHHNASQLASNFVLGGASGSSMDDFRSVIDDLTVENKKLKEKLRKYERTYGAHLEKDRLFEVKVHGLDPEKKRELEETLHAFASSIRKDESTNDLATQILPKEDGHAETSVRHDSKHPSSTSTNSQLVDSAYASLSTSGHVSSSTLNHTGLDKKNDSRGAASKTRNIQTPLDDIPQGLLPKHPTVMTERGKKKLVVRRLEQLFTGKLRVRRGADSQPQQQQEVSNSAARDDRQAIKRRGQQVVAEGVREAHILDTEMELERAKMQKTSGEGSADSSTPSQAECGERGTDVPSSPDQRPTRPLDLDPDRAQVPAENMEYIRHLGISTPLMLCEDPTDLMVDDSHGWVYLNLLINMAQLHIINVTPDFIRSAVSELSTKFQLSHDGRKIRWRGGTEGTELSSDSGGDNALRYSPNDSDSVDEENQENQKIDSTAHRGSSTLEQVAKQGRFLSIPINGPGQSQPISVMERRRNFQYKPLFAHRPISEGDSMSLDVDDCTSQPSVDESGMGLTSNGARAIQRRSHSGQRFKRKRDDGAIVFYSGAPFCIDLSGDRDSIPTPLHLSAVDIDGFSNHSYDALGCGPNKPSNLTSFRTPSASLSHFRSVKDYSFHARPVLEGETSSSTPELIQNGEHSDLTFLPQWLSTEEQHNLSPVILEACGLGGARPSDHFIYSVETRWRKLDEKTRLRLSKYPPLGSRSRRFLHSIPKSSLNVFPLSYNEDDRPPHVDLLIDQTISNIDFEPLALPLQAEILRTHFQYLEPSKLPPPANFHGPISSSIESSGDSSSEGDGGEVTSLWQRSRLPTYMPDTVSSYDPMVEDYWGGIARRGDVEESDDSSIDILAHARETDPEAVALKEREFEREILLQSGRERAATVDKLGEASSSGTSVEESEEL